MFRSLLILMLLTATEGPDPQKKIIGSLTQSEPAEEPEVDPGPEVAGRLVIAPTLKSHRYVNGVRYDIQDHEGIQVWAAFSYTEDEYPTVQLLVVNGSEVRIDVLPQNCHLSAVLLITRSERQTLSRLRRLSPEYIADEVTSRLRIAAFLANLADALPTQQTATYQESGSIHGSGGFAHWTATGTMRISPSAADMAILRANAQARADRVIAATQAVAEELSTAALLANTIDPGQFIGGSVYYEPRRRVKAYTLAVELDPHVFVFEWRVK